MEDGGLPEGMEDIDYNNLNQDQKAIVDEAMPFLFQLESDGGGDHNFMHFQNACSDIALFAVMQCDKLVHYRCAAGHSYLNSSKRG